MIRVLNRFCTQILSWFTKNFMMSPLKLIILARDQSSHVQNAWSQLAEFLKHQHDVEIVAAAVTEDVDFTELHADLVVVLGGDGAILRACRHMGNRQLPILGINLGRLGFLADLSLKTFTDQFDLLRRREFHVVSHLMFECTHQSAEAGTQTFTGLNEVAISSAASLSLIDVQLLIDEEPVTTYSGDGVIISTPVGSTAHNLSAGGPILRQDLQAFVITPICPHTLTNRPIVDHADRVYQFCFEQIPEGVMVVIDGQIKRALQSGDTIEVRKSSICFQLARIPGHSFYAALHGKLGWSGQPRYQKKRR